MNKQQHLALECASHNFKRTSKSSSIQMYAVWSLPHWLMSIPIYSNRYTYIYSNLHFLEHSNPKFMSWNHEKLLKTPPSPGDHTGAGCLKTIALCHLAALEVTGGLTCLVREGLGSSRVARVMHRSVLDSLYDKPSSPFSSPPQSSPLRTLKSPSFLILNVLRPVVFFSFFLFSSLLSPQCCCLVLTAPLPACLLPGNHNLEHSATQEALDTCSCGTAERAQLQT